MSLTIEGIEAAKDDKELFDRLTKELSERFPPDLQQNRDQFLAALAASPRGLRAMAGIFDLDVSLSLDDLAWHFGNHNDERFLNETVVGLKELGAQEASDIFASAWEIVKPHLPEIRSKDWDAEEFHEYLEKNRIQSKLDPLNDRMWKLCEECGELGIMNYWVTYARNHPERCVRT